MANHLHGCSQLLAVYGRFLTAWLLRDALVVHWRNLLIHDRCGHFKELHGWSGAARTLYVVSVPLVRCILLLTLRFLAFTFRVQNSLSSRFLGTLEYPTEAFREEVSSSVMIYHTVIFGWRHPTASRSPYLKPGASWESAFGGCYAFLWWEME